MAVDTSDLSLYVDVEEMKDTADLATKAWRILQRDRTELLKIDEYVNGDQPGPYTPKGANQEYKILAQRAQTNMLKIVLATPAQSLFAEGYRETATAVDLKPAEPGAKIDSKSNLWSAWQRNRLDSRQSALYREVLKSGVAFVGVNQPETGADARYNYPRAFTLSPLRTVALYVDPANDDVPTVVFTVDRLPEKSLGRGRMWDSDQVYNFKIDADGTVSNIQKTPHGFDFCPIVPFYAFRDLEGRTSGIIAHLLPIQDRLNQTIFDLLVAQTYGSFLVRYATGMTPPPLRERMAITVGEVRGRRDPAHELYGAPDDTVYGYRMVTVVDDSGNPLPAPVSADITRFLVAEDPDTKFGTLDATPLDGFIASAAMSLSHLATISQLPPHYLLGNIANLSADALAVAESSLQRMISEFQHGFGEAWEQVMALFAVATDREPDYGAEIMWRDTSPKSFASTVDGLVKLAEGGIVPRKGIRSMIPGVTAGALDTWQELEDEEAANPTDPRLGIKKAIADHATAITRPAPAVPAEAPRASYSRGVAAEIAKNATA